VLKDVLERWETMNRAQDLYGVVLVGSAEDETLTVDVDATLRRRADLRATRAAAILLQT
jgi:N-methylhydantoinase B